MSIPTYRASTPVRERLCLTGFGLLLALGACSDAQDSPPSPSKGGSSGSTSTGGTAGTLASGGASGAGAAGNAGGSSGSGGGQSGGSSGGGAGGSGGGEGSSGSGGAGGSGGASGSGGTGGSGGASGSGGTGGSGGGDRASCKRGVAYGHHSEADMRALSPAVTWWYNWAVVPDQGVRSGAYTTLGVEFVPMVWGGSFNVDAVVRDVPQGARFLLGFNEPNFHSQADMTAARAAELWPRIEEIAERRNLALVSPAVNFCGGGCHDTNPFDYLRDFFAACQGCRVDYIGIHIYVGCNTGGQNRAQWLIDHVNSYKAQFDKPFWLTEFACDDAGSLEDQRRFMVDAVNFLENEPRVQRYAWFAGRATNVRNASLLGADGELTVLGQTYVDLPHHSSCRP